MKNMNKVSWVLAALLAVSVSGNALLYVKAHELERLNTYLDESLKAFANLTGAVVKQAKLTAGDVRRSGMIGSPPYAEGKGYLIDVDDYHDRGIKYIFDADGKLTGWCPIQPVEDHGRKTLECMQRAQVPDEAYVL